MSENKQNIGTVVQIIGAELDIKFTQNSLPALLNSIEIDNNGQKLVVEVAQHIGDDLDSVKQGRQAVLRKFNVKHCADDLNNSADILFVF